MNIDRELKFRTWNCIDNKMIYWKINDLLLRFGESKSQHNVDDILMECTGLEDKNENEVYKLDIILLDGKKYLVDWSYDNAGFCFRSQEPNHPDYDIIGGFHNCNEFEIIGNWYENQELLKEVE